MMMLADGLQESMCSFPPQPHANSIKEDYKLFQPFSIWKINIKKKKEKKKRVHETLFLINI
jgi:hypothetical protein